MTRWCVRAGGGGAVSHLESFAKGHAAARPWRRWERVPQDTSPYGDASDAAQKIASPPPPPRLGRWRARFYLRRADAGDVPRRGGNVKESKMLLTRKSRGGLTPTRRAVRLLVHAIPEEDDAATCSATRRGRCGRCARRGRRRAQARGPGPDARGPGGPISRDRDAHRVRRCARTAGRGRWSVHARARRAGMFETQTLNARTAPETTTAESHRGYFLKLFTRGARDSPRRLPVRRRRGDRPGHHRACSRRLQFRAAGRRMKTVSKKRSRRKPGPPRWRRRCLARRRRRARGVGEARAWARIPRAEPQRRGPACASRAAAAALVCLGTRTDGADDADDTDGLGQETGSSFRRASPRRR